MARQQPVVVMLSCTLLDPEKRTRGLWKGGGEMLTVGLPDQDREPRADASLQISRSESEFNFSCWP
ncbi:uncharacterized protein QC763_705824 [Podospora pseudopauciseta]|nr:hypothetical protein QC763_705824 [Podospora pseudopauciseta]KAK4668203.1 hypothetical protein QC764_705824 [Podospora pseudoanserina]